MAKYRTDPSRIVINSSASRSIFDEPKIDCHNHILDPLRFPYGAQSPYRPAGQEIITAAQFLNVMDLYGVRNALVVEPNSGYNSDNRCLLDAIKRSDGRFKGIAVVPEDVELADLVRLKSQEIIGVAFNPTFHGLAYYSDTRDLLAKLVELDMILQIQVEDDQALTLLPLVEHSSVRLLIDHCGRPVPGKGLDQPGFTAVLGLAQTGRASVKLSGLGKFSRQPYPHGDTWPYVNALVQAFSLDACVWGSIRHSCGRPSKSIMACC